MKGTIDLQKATKTMYLIVGWTIVGSFAVTIVITFLALTKTVELADPSYLDRLFTVLVVEIIGCALFMFRRGVRGSDTRQPMIEYFEQASALMGQANAARREGNLEEADRLLADVLALRADGLPFDIKTVFKERGELAFEKNLWRNAAVSYAIYHEIDSTDLDVLIKYGRSLRELNRYQEAYDVYKSAIKIYPNNYSLLNGLQNITRRLAGFFQSAERGDVAEEWFNDTRDHINAMLRIAPSKDIDEKKYLNARLAQARLFWQWERYLEAQAVFGEIIKEFPEHDGAKEDLAAALLEYAGRGGGNVAIKDALKLFKQLYMNATDSTDIIFVGSGYAEAVSRIKNPSRADLERATEAVLLSLAKNQSREEDPYPFYAASLIFYKTKEVDKAIDYLNKAIHCERRRSADIYTFDYVRLVQYEKLLQSWEVKDQEKSGNEES